MGCGKKNSKKQFIPINHNEMREIIEAYCIGKTENCAKLEVFKSSLPVKSQGKTCGEN
jgi:hypothetical protein